MVASKKLAESTRSLFFKKFLHNLKQFLKITFQNIFCLSHLLYKSTQTVACTLRKRVPAVTICDSVPPVTICGSVPAVTICGSAAENLYSGNGIEGWTHIWSRVGLWLIYFQLGRCCIHNEWNNSGAKSYVAYFKASRIGVGSFCFLSVCLVSTGTVSWF